MARIAAYIRSNAPIFAVITIPVFIVMAAISAMRLAQGSFAPFRSTSDVVYRLTVLALIPVMTGLLCAVLIDLLDRARSLLKRRR